MTDYSLATSYANDYELADDVEGVTWEKSTAAGPVLLTGLKGCWGDFDTAESQSVAAGLSFTNEAAAVVVWQPISTSNPTHTFAPAEGNILRREEKGSEGWLILRSMRSPRGHWICACQKEITNG